MFLNLLKHNMHSVDIEDRIYCEYTAYWIFTNYWCKQCTNLETLAVIQKSVGLFLVSHTQTPRVTTILISQTIDLACLLWKFIYTLMNLEDLFIMLPIFIDYLFSMLHNTPWCDHRMIYPFYCKKIFFSFGYY